jgi:putative membrane protein
MEPTDLPPLRGNARVARFPLVLAGILAIVFAATAWNPPAGHREWLLEVGPALIGIAVLAAVFPRFPMSRLIYAGVFLHSLVLTYGGYYTYALTPLGNWAKDAFHLARNHYDRVGHLALGFFPALTVREVLLRVTPLRRGGWLDFLVVSVILAAAAFYEFIEWWAALLLDPAGGDAFLGSQGDIWDAQWDMFLGMVGAILSLLALSRAHDRSMARLAREAGAGPAR